MVCSKAESTIAENYDVQLVGDAVPDALMAKKDKARLLRMGEDLRARLDDARSAVLDVSGNSELIEGNPHVGGAARGARRRRRSARRAALFAAPRASKRAKRRRSAATR